MSTLLLTLMVACGGLFDPSDLDVTAGSCEGSSLEKDRSLDTGVPHETAVWAEADGSTIVLHLDDVDANCCPSPGATLTRDGTDLHVDFLDVTDDMACGCMCWTDFTVEILDNDPGTYTVTVDYYDELLGTAEVVVS
jgi:hypothetical protein